MTKQIQLGDTPITQRLWNSKKALTATIQKILDLNKLLRRNQKPQENLEIKQELKLLNKVADQQAKIVQLYELRLQNAGAH